MMGVVIDVKVVKGAVVTVGQPLCVLSAMKVCVPVAMWLCVCACACLCSHVRVPV